MLPQSVHTSRWILQHMKVIVVRIQLKVSHLEIIVSRVVEVCEQCFLEVDDSIVETTLRMNDQIYNNTAWPYVPTFHIIDIGVCYFLPVSSYHIFHVLFGRSFLWYVAFHGQRILEALLNFELHSNSCSSSVIKVWKLLVVAKLTWPMKFEPFVFLSIRLA